jgi:hypothetical protein
MNRHALATSARNDSNILASIRQRLTSNEVLQISHWHYNLGLSWEEISRGLWLVYERNISQYEAWLCWNHQKGLISN